MRHADGNKIKFFNINDYCVVRPSGTIYYIQTGMVDRTERTNREAMNHAYRTIKAQRLNETINLKGICS